MHTYETLLFLATEPFSENILQNELQSSDAVLKRLNSEFSQTGIDTRQANETISIQLNIN